MNDRRLLEVSPRDPRAVALLTAYFDELRERFKVDIDVSEVVSGGDLLPPDGVFVLVLDGEEAVACGGVRMLAAMPGQPSGDRAGEIKRMFVAPAARRRGHARALLEALELSAIARGATRMVLDTDARDIEAIGLYMSCGYVATAPYNDNEDASAWFEKRLGGG